MSNNQVHIVPAVELDHYLPQLFNLINAAFRSQDKSAYDNRTNPFPGWQRLENKDQIKLEVGQNGLVAMILDRSATGDTERVVAVACVKPWKGRVVVDTTLEQTKREQPGRHDWEVALCAADPDPRYRGQGLVSRCVAAMIQRLQASTSGEPVVLWISALVNVGSAEYWERRGFIQQGEPDLAATGTWDSVAPFRIATLKRVHE
jgi:ribosomal protein S18 acetylase RimI-like enzyme